MKEEEITLDGKKVKVITKLPESEIEENNLNRCLDETIDLTKIIKEIKKDE